jgi:hypothetical protein
MEIPQKEPVVHFERGERLQYATRLISTNPDVFEHHCVRNYRDPVQMPEEFYAFDSSRHMTTEEFENFVGRLNQLGG